MRKFSEVIFEKSKDFFSLLDELPNLLVIPEQKDSKSFKDIDSYRFKNNRYFIEEYDQDRAKERLINELKKKGWEIEGGKIPDTYEFDKKRINRTLRFSRTIGDSTENLTLYVFLASPYDKRIRVACDYTSTEVLIADALHELSMLIARYPSVSKQAFIDFLSK